MQVGAQLTMEYAVTPDDLASVVSTAEGDDFPAVLATSRVVALMEIAAARLMRPLLGQGELSVGVGIELRHTAPTLEGQPVRAIATFTGMNKRLYLFEVELHDQAGVAAKGTHSRAVVETRRIEQAAAERAGRTTT